MKHATEKAYAAVRNALLLLLPGYEVIRGNQTGPKPITDHATVTPLQSNSIGWAGSDQAARSDGNLDDTISGHEQWIVSVNFYCRDPGAAQSLCRRFSNALMSDTINELLDEAGFGFVSATPIRDLTAIEKMSWESRAQLDVTLSAIYAETFRVFAIDSAPLDGTLEGAETPMTSSSTLNLKKA